jgi:PAS domain S-box-containing protein
MLKSEFEVKRLARWALLSLSVWTAVVGYSLYFTIQMERESAMAMARNTARANFFKDQAFRLWASEKGGLYVVVDENNRPVPFMSHVPDRDIEATGGRRLTLMNPASMLREMMDQYAGLYGIKGRIVGIVTLNPANKADPWEEKAIRAFERGEKEVYEVADMGGQPHLRLIRPMVMQPACMKCHGHLGFKVGDVRGAVGIAVPLGEYLASARVLERQSWLIHGAVWLVGLAGGGLFFRGQRRRILERENSIDDLALAARVFEDGLTAIAITDSDGLILRVNKAFVEMTGYAPEEVVGHKLSLLKSGMHGPAFYAAMWQALLDKGQWSGEIWNRRKDGHLFAASERNSALRDEHGRIRNCIVMFEDISERKRTEAALRESEARWQFALEGAGAGVWDWNLATNALYLSSGWKAQLGYQDHELANDYTTWETRVHPDDLPRVMSELTAYLEARSPDFDVEYRMRSKSGEYVWIRARGKVMERDAQGKPLRMLGIHDDVTARKRVELARENRILALTRPTEAVEDIDFVELVDLEDIQRLQDVFADAFGVASLITTPAGVPITRPSGFTQLCGQLVRANAEGARRCEYSDSILGRHNPDGPNIQHCLSAGLCNAGASITVGGRHVANWLIGQVRDETHDERRIVEFAGEIGADEAQLAQAFREVPTMPREQFERVARILFAMASQISAMAYQNVRQARFIAERERVEDDLLRSEARYREAQHMARLGHWSYEVASQRFLWLSEETFRLLGLDPALGAPDYATFIARVHADDRDRVNRVVEQSVAGGEPFVVGYRILLAEGAIHHLEARGEARRDEEGRAAFLSGTVMDVTERRLAEERLEIFQSLAEASFDAIVMARPEDMTLLYANRAAHVMFGCDYDKREMHGLAGGCFWAREDHAVMEDVIRQALAGGWRGDVRQRRMDGTLFDANATVFSIGGADGHPSRIVAIIRDISEKKLDELALQTANAKLEAIIDFLPDATFVVDSEKRVIAWNRAIEKMTGVAKADILGKLDAPYGEAFYGEHRPVLIDLILDKRLDGDILYSSLKREGEALIAEGETPAVFGGRGAYIWATALPLKDHAGRVLGAIECARDISESRRAEQVLKESEERLRLALDGTSDGIWDWNLASGKAYFSPRYYTMLGYAPDEFPGCYESWRNLVHPDDLAKAEATLNRHVAEGGSPYAVEARMRAKDGGWRWILGRGKAVEWDGAGRPTRLAGSHTDITERKETENALRLTQFSVDHASEAIFWYDPEGRFSYVNDQGARMLGYDRRELVGMTILDVDANIRPEDFRPMMDALVQAGSMQIESRLRRKDGGLIDVVISAMLIRFGGQDKLVAHIRDITDQKRAEQSLLREKHFSDSLINSLPGVFYLFDEDIRFTRWNRNLSEISGYPEEAIAAMSATDFIAEEDRGRVAETIQAILRDGAASVEAELLTASGERIPFYFSGLRMREGDRTYIIGSGIDISERRQAEEALRLTQFGVERSSDAVFLIDAESRFTSVNEAACASLGYSREELQALGITDVDPNVSPDMAKGLFHRLREKGRLRIETFHRRKDGTVFPVEVMANYIDFNGKAYNFCYVRDISERKQAEAALHLTRRAIDDAEMAFEWYDDKGRIVDVNRHSCVELGYSREEMLKLRLCDIDPGFPAERWAETWHAIKRDGSVNTESTHIRKDGSTFPVQITGNHVAFDGREYVFAYAQNITERRRAEEILRLTQFAIDHSSVAFEWLSAEGEVMASNIEAPRALGYGKEEFIGMRVWDYDPDFSAERWQDFWNALKADGSVTAETRHRRKDGSIFPIEVTANHVQFGEMEYCFAYITDITKRKAAEQALRELNATLEARVHEEVAKNRDKDHLLIQQSRLAAMGEMMGNIAHQWRQPINALSLVLANIKDAYEFDQLDRAYLDNQVERGGHLIHRMSATIDDFRGFFRPDRTRQAFSLARAVRDAMMIVDLSYAHAKIALELEPGEDVVCFGFPNEYAQVVLNLLGNAKNAIVERKIPAGRVTIRIGRAGRNGRLILCDNGGGIPADALPRIFEPYFTTREQGTGIGLNMSRMIIENMGGHIEVANADGGARVTLTTPLAPENVVPGRQ